MLHKKHILCAVLVISTLTLAGCGGDKTKQEVSTKPQSDKDKINALEASGALPKLDRTATLAGIDANKDGVRDDIEVYINKTYSQPEQKAAARQEAKSMQAILSAGTMNTKVAKVLDLQSEKSMNCLFLKFDELKGHKYPGQVSREIVSMSTNTKARLLAYLAYNKALDGTVLATSEGDTCE
jgi:outer membrane murein-binding lipoprotein Lpp